MIDYIIAFCIGALLGAIIWFIERFFKDLKDWFYYKEKE